MPSRLPALSAAAAVLLAVLAPPAATGAATARTCSLGTKEARTFGPSYVTTIRVTATGCTTGKRVVRAYQRCRRADGGARGHCHKHVLGYRCTEQRGSIPTQITGKVTCRNGHIVVLHTYEELLT